MRKPKKWDLAKVRLCAWLRMRVWKGLVYIFHWESLPHSRLVGGKYKLLSAAISSPLLCPSSSLPPKESVDLLQRVLFGFPWLTRIAPRHRSQWNASVPPEKKNNFKIHSWRQRDKGIGKKCLNCYHNQRFISYSLLPSFVLRKTWFQMLLALLQSTNFPLQKLWSYNWVGMEKHSLFLKCRAGR